MPMQPSLDPCSCSSFSRAQTSEAYSCQLIPCVLACSGLSSCLDALQPPAYESTLSFLVKPFFPHIVPILFIGARRRIKLPELRDIPLHLRSDPATEKLLAALAVEDSTSDRYLANVRFTLVLGLFLT